MHAVEIRIPDDRLPIDYMTTVCDWLRQRDISPQTFRYTFELPGVALRVDFRDPAEASAFAVEFLQMATAGSAAEPALPPRLGRDPAVARGGIERHAAATGARPSEASS